jgi:HAD superfamily hydrolase (TIGR01484 family)
MAKKVIAFDLDDTLAVTKSPISDKMGLLLVELLESKKVCIISGGKFEQFKKQVIDRLSAQINHLNNLHILPTCGTRYYTYDEKSSSWKLQYAEDLPKEQRAEIIKSVEKEARTLGMWAEKTWGDIMEDRISQITYSALGQQAPPEAKYKWADDNKENKKVLREKLAEKFPELEVRLGGSTSIDITRPGIDKAYGMKKIMDALSVSKEEILFVGDKLEESGNDYPVKAMGIDTIAVERWEDTALVVETINKLSK